MHRVLFEIGPLTFYSYGLFVAVGFLLASFFIVQDARRVGIPENSMLDCLLAVLVGGLIGGRILFVLINREIYLADPLKILMLYEGGLAFQGALFGGLVSGIAVAKIRKMPVLRSCDVIAPYIALGQAIGRIGCFLNGCCYGKIIESGIGVTFPGDDFMRIPVQLYSSAALFILFIALVLFRRVKSVPSGSIFAAYLFLCGIYRILIEFLRNDNPAVFFGMTLAQVLSVCMIVAGVVMWIVLYRKRVKGLKG